MKKLNELSLLPEYRSFEQNIVQDFYIPTLKRAKYYKRAVGFFSSSSLTQITTGIIGLLKNNGKIRIIASPKLSEDDIKAIEEGYIEKEKVVESSLYRFFIKEQLEQTNPILKERFSLLVWLIKNNFLEIKLAVLNNNNKIGMYHEKLGLISDGENQIAFFGSMNETETALKYNFESFDVYTSWSGNDGKERVKLKENAFDRLWNNKMTNVDIIDFPEAIKQKVIEITKDPDFKKIEEIESKMEKVKEQKVEFKIPAYYPKVPEFISLREYQIKAIQNFESQNFIGIFDMATGTGKTITGLSAAAYLFEKKKRLALIIVVPYQHLVEQWVEDVVSFNMGPVVAYSTTSDKNWRSRLETYVTNFTLNINNHFCLVTTNATYSTEFVQKQIKKLKDDTLLIVDEAHNFGAKHLQKGLLENIPYRLALSATIERHNDVEGTDALLNYFGEKAIEYSLEEAIKNKMLTPYYYYPIVVGLTEKEREKYKELTVKIIRSIITDKFGNKKLTESAKTLLIQRARLVAGAQNKIHKLSEKIEHYKKQSNILVYCGATTINDESYDETNPDIEELRQIDIVTDLLGNQKDMKVAQFTSRETIKEREEIKEVFSEGNNLQALIAIRCLDEGVDIPNIRTAFILASSTNPKEYIQRRGRVLRLAKNKTHAVIYDFITLPDELDELNYYDSDELRSYRGLANREIIRMRDFARSALNSSEADGLIYQLEDLLNLHEGAEFSSYE